MYKGIRDILPSIHVRTVLLGRSVRLPFSGFQDRADLTILAYAHTGAACIANTL
jgi:hypothetical protein